MGRVGLRGRLGPCAAIGAVALAAAAALAAAGEPAGRADVLAAAVSGAPGAYRFAVTVRSPDRGCDRYASFWEVVRADGSLAYRRILQHSHVDEQPFARDGGPVPIGPDDEVVVRAFLHPDGYGGAALRGAVARGFRPWTDAPADFAAALAASPPRPEGCRF
jgi:hypothetical protein